MQYRKLGSTGLRVSELCLGTMQFGWTADEALSLRILDAAFQAGVNFIDTADIYSIWVEGNPGGVAETVIGKWLKKSGIPRHQVVIATKVRGRMGSGPNDEGLSRAHILDAVEASLRRLGTDYIDLYQTHWFDENTTIDETLRALDDLVRQGKVLYVGISDSPDWIVAEANARAELMGWSRFVAMQIPYSLLDRAVERAVLPMAKHWEMTVLPWGLLESGVLTGKFLQQVEGPSRVDPQKLNLSEKAMQVVLAVKQVAEESGRPMSQVAINWVRQQRQAHIIPLLGARKLEQLQDNLAALEWQLDEAQLQRLDEASAIELGFPHGLLDGNPYLFGATYEKIDAARR